MDPNDVLEEYAKTMRRVLQVIDNMTIDLQLKLAERTKAKPRQDEEALFATRVVNEQSKRSLFADRSSASQTGARRRACARSTVE